ncbi:unnamed protein product [Colias eurytheme]|nr:unnamed protein product [Colias eurytheme]
MNLNQYVTEPTHFVDETQTLLDLVCSNSPIKEVIVDYIPSLSHHAFICSVINVKKEKPVPRWITFRPLKDIDFVEFNRFVSNINLDFIRCLSNVNEMVNALTNLTLSIFDCYAPNKTKYLKEKSYPWITYNIKLMMRRRDEAHARARQGAEYRTYYNELKKYVKEAIVREKNVYFDKYINSNFDYPKILWKHIKDQVNIKESNDADLPLNICDPDEINNHFLNVPGNGDIQRNIIDNFIAKRYQDSDTMFHFTNISEENVIQALKALHSNAMGVDGISLDMITVFLEAENILPHLQSGFRKGRSTTTALADVVDNVLALQDQVRKQYCGLKVILAKDISL